jgi:hypothetical protein
LSGNLEEEAETLRFVEMTRRSRVPIAVAKAIDPIRGNDEKPDPESSFKVTVSDYFTLAATAHVYIFTQKPSF